MIIRERNARNEHCAYDTDKHIYWKDVGADGDAEGNVLGEMVSVTRLIGQFYLVSPWKGENCDVEFGNRVHKVAACCMNGVKTTVSPYNEQERKAFSALWKFAKRIHDHNEIVGVEKIIFSECAGVAGTLDLVFKCNGKLFVCDWKTGNVLLPAKCKFNSPFSHLVADPLTIYSLQCSMYQVLMEIGGYAVNEVFAPARLLWLHEYGSEPKVDALTCRDLRREAATMIAMRGYTPWYVDWMKRCPF